MLKKKTEWYSKKIDEVKVRVGNEREKMGLDAEAMERDFLELEEQRRAIDD